MVTGTGGSDYGVDVESPGQITSGGAGTVMVNGTGGAGPAIYEIGVRMGGGTITSGGGDVRVTGQGGGGDGGFNEGVLVIGQITSGGGGIVTVTGTSSGTGGMDYGIDLESPGEITSGGAGAVTVNGTGGSGSAVYEMGVRVGGGTITSGGGTVSVTGQGGGSTSGTGTGLDGSDYGVDVNATGEITSGGAGTVTVMGTAGSEPATYQIGVRVGGGTITSGGGAVSVTGQGGGSGSGVTSEGVDLEQSGQISSGGSGMITVTGTGGSGSGSQNYGVSVSDAGSVITSGGGAVSVTGTGDADSEAISLQTSGVIASDSNAPITLTADSLSIDNTSTIDSGTGLTTIVPHTAGTLIALGGTEVLTSSPLTLGLSAAEIAQVTAGTLTIGNTQSGEVDITTAVSFSSPVVNVTTGSGYAIAFSGTGSLADSGNVTLTTSGTGAITSTTSATDITVGAGTTSLNAGSGGIGASGSPIMLSGTNLDATTSGNGNEFLSVVGSITIDSTGLNAGTGTVELDGGTFTLDGNNLINTSATLNVIGATVAIGAFNETGEALTLTGGTISGTTGVFTSANTFQVQSGTVSAILAGTNGLTKTTNGTVTLSGSNTYGGATTVSGGVLDVDGDDSAAIGAVTVDSGGTLGGTGVLGGDLMANAGGTVTPGPSVTSGGTLTIEGNLSLASGSTLAVVINGAEAGEYSQLVVLGSPSIAGAELSVSAVGFTLSPSTRQIFPLIDNEGGSPVVGTFTGLPAGTRVTVIGSTVTPAITYIGGSGKSVELIVFTLPVQPIVIGGTPNGLTTGFSLNSSTGEYAPTGSVYPFDDFSVDIRSAIGDVNGDGIPDVIYVTGPGTLMEVTVISGQDGSVLVPPFAPFTGFTGGGFVSAGDFLDNGRDQIVVSPDRSGGPRVAIFDFNGTSVADGTEINPVAELTRVANFFTLDSNFRGGARTAVGDLNGDGVPDLVVAAGYGGGPIIEVINGTRVIGTNGFTPSDDLVGNFYGFSSSLRDGAYVAVGDVLGNGEQDLILGPGDGGPDEVEILSGEQLVNEGAMSAIANPVALFTPTGLGSSGSGLRVAVAATGVGDQVNVVVGTGRNLPGLVKVYPGTGFTSGSTSEPTGGQLLDPFGGGTLADGIFVG